MVVDYLWWVGKFKDLISLCKSELTSIFGGDIEFHSRIRGVPTLAESM